MCHPLDRLWLVGVGVVECPNYVRSVSHIFLRLPACGICGVVESQPLNKVEEAQALSVVINFAIEDSLDLILVGFFDLERRRQVVGPIRD